MKAKGFGDSHKTSKQHGNGFCTLQNVATGNGKHCWICLLQVQKGRKLNLHWTLSYLRKNNFFLTVNISAVFSPVFSRCSTALRQMDPDFVNILRVVLGAHRKITCQHLCCFAPFSQHKLAEKWWDKNASVVLDRGEKPIRTRGLVDTNNFI